MNIMTEQLPISIQVSDDLIVEISHIAAISNKLEAQLNFHTMTANWYGDEDNMLEINFFLLCVNELEHQEKSRDGDFNNEFLADDVMITSPLDKLVDCYVAITESELLLLQKTPKLLSGYLGKKLTKVLNLIAERYDLEKI
ncbi:MAG: hypothetical protein WBC60_04710 [Cognaticolwellia sp.]